MVLLKFLKKETDAPNNRIIFMAILSGIANAMLLAFANMGADNVWDQHLEGRIMVMYIIAFILYVYTLRYAFFQTAIAFEVAIRNMQMRLAEKIRRVEVPFIEQTGHSSIYTQLTEGSNTVSQAALLITSASQSFIVVLTSLLYATWLSSLSAVIMITMLVGGILWYIKVDRQISQELLQANSKENEFFSLLTQMLEGFKELKINQRKSDDLFQEIDTVATQHEQLKTNASIRSVTVIMSGRIVFYILLGLIIFVLPRFDFLQPQVIFKLTATTLFLIGPLNMIIGSLPMLARTNVALTNLYNLEVELDSVISNQTQPTLMPLEQFQQIHLSEILFHYSNKEGKPLFSVGPLNLTIQRGERIFIIGGNGSGKSTLLKLLTGLYYPASGSLWVDNEEIDHVEYQSYRELFAIIFTDFHLFDKLYGSRDVERRQVQTWLRRMELDKKTKYLEGKFSHLDLSTGQKKRLAFIVAMLENKLIYVFDELAADQDPSFRRKFYEEILPDLKTQGKTVIVVTHDDKYFHTADRILKMEYGQLVHYEPQNTIV